MLSRAEERARGLANTELRLGDAATLTLDVPADVLFSRFGVMFFADPRRAFGNLAAMLRPGGRVAFVCWRALADNPWARVPFEAARQVLTRRRPRSTRRGLARSRSPTRLTSVRSSKRRGSLRSTLDPFDAALTLGDTLDEAVAFAVFAGPAARLLNGVDDAVVARAHAAISRALTPFAARAPVQLPGAVWIVSARR